MLVVEEKNHPKLNLTGKRRFGRRKIAIDHINLSWRAARPQTKIICGNRKGPFLKMVSTLISKANYFPEEQEHKRTVP